MSLPKTLSLTAIPSPGDQSRLYWLLAAALVAFVAYIPAIRGGFIWDDDAYVTANLTLRDLPGLARIWTSPLSIPQYYPLVHTTFWLEYHLWQLWPAGYHFDNVMLHIAGAFVLFALLRQQNVPGAMLAAILFMLHPVHVESVAWVTERKNVLSGLLYLLSMYSYLKWAARRPREGQSWATRNSLYFLSLVLFVAALLSKSVTASMPAAILLVIWWKRDLRRSDVWPLVPFFVLGIGMGQITSYLERTHVGASGPEWSWTFLERCFIAGRALWIYAEKLAFPFGLSFIYPRWSLGRNDPVSYLFPILCVIVPVALWSGRKLWGRGPLVCVLLFAGTLFPALGFVNVFPMRYSFVADHFQYLASIGLIVGFAYLAQRASRPLPAAARIAGAAVLCIALSVLTWQRSTVLADAVVLWKDTIQKNPSNWLAPCKLGIELVKRGRSKEAEQYLRKAVELNPTAGDTHAALAWWLAQPGRDRLKEAEGELREALRIEPTYSAAHVDLADVLYRQDRFAEAIPELKLAAASNGLSSTYSKLGFCLEQCGRFDEAIGSYREAINRAGGAPDPDAYFSLGNCLLKIGSAQDAIESYQNAISIRPKDPDYLTAVGNAFLRVNDRGGAFKAFARALSIQPENVEARDGMKRAQNGN